MPSRTNIKTLDKYEKLLRLCRQKNDNYGGEWLFRNYSYEGDGKYSRSDIAVIKGFIKDYHKTGKHTIFRLQVSNELWRYLNGL